jgi:hypothetical protein
MFVVILIEPLLKRFDITYINKSNSLKNIEAMALYFGGDINDDGTSLNITEVTLHTEKSEDTLTVKFKDIASIVECGNSNPIGHLEWFNMYDVTNSDQINEFISEVKAGYAKKKSWFR